MAFSCSELLGCLSKMYLDSVGAFSLEVSRLLLPSLYV